MAELSFWERELYGNSYDLIVIGAGLTGQSIAHFYKKSHPDSSVLVLDRGFFPLGASTRNAGFACFGSVTEHMADLEIENEVQIIDRIRRRFAGLKLLRETLGDVNIDYKEPGSYEIFTDSKKFDEAVDHLSMANRWLEEAAGIKNVYSAISYNDFPAIQILHEGSLHPGKMMKSLYQLNIKQGVEFRWNAPVKDVDPNEGDVKLQNEIVLHAKKIALATNAFTSSLLKEIEIIPGRGNVFITKPMNDMKWKGTFHYDRGYYYFRSVGENRFLLGGARSLNIDVETTTEFGINNQIKNHLTDFANNVLQLPEGWEIEQEWSGIMGFTKSKGPILKKTGNKCVVAAGLSGMGVALGMQLGKEAAEMLN